ncbi:MAG: hypothetical protein JWN73_4011 [Betaproteobacteria bacterium]|nr:hypothetical protein [Betaproteobacteria bacterium]
MDIKAMVGGGRKVRFRSYREREFWYETECGFIFPVPLDELESAELLAEDKAILFMRYIRKHAALIEGARFAQNAAQSAAQA